MPQRARIRGNAIDNNGGLGIDLVVASAGAGVGVNANDLDAVSVGPDAYMNYPVVSAAALPMPAPAAPSLRNNSLASIRQTGIVAIYSGPVSGNMRESIGMSASQPLPTRG